jgi:hypothetical protein
LSGEQRLRPGRSANARTAAAIVATAVLALLAAACGGTRGSQVAQLGSTTTQSDSSSSPQAASGQQNGAIAFSQCMRSNGVPKFPDPASGGAIPKVALQQLGVSSSQFQAAQSACRHLLPNGGSGPSPAQVQQVKVQSLEFSRCVRSHGVPNFPDPASDGRIPDPATVGINQGSPKFESANQACREYRPPYMPSNAAYNAYVRAQG